MINKYNLNDKQSIFEYAKGLEGKTFGQVCDEDDVFLNQNQIGISEEEYKEAYENNRKKGGLGEIIEERYFHYKADNLSRADFPEAELELKVTPYKMNKDNSLSAKERLIISMINYCRIVDMDFYDSNAWEKLKNILMIFYLWDPDKSNRLDYLINYVYLFSPKEEDLDIIKSDFYKIKQKVLDGKAHELSESDTLYLGAATKSSDSSKRTKQPYSNTLAKPRAFSFKNSYMTYILRNYVLLNYEPNENIIDGLSTLPFEEYVINEVNKYRGKSDIKLFQELFGENELRSKDKYSRLALEILGVKTENAAEFEKANIVVKAIRVEENNSIRESISFPYFVIKDLINEEWESSSINEFFCETKFLFIVYKKRKSNYYLQGAKFWNMPMSDIDGTLREEWERGRNIFREGVKLTIDDNRSIIRNNLPKKRNTKILHIRPHALKSAYIINGVKYGNGKIGRDTDDLPNGDKMTKQCFWLNYDYVLKQINEIL